MIEISDLIRADEYFGDLRLATRLAEAAMKAQEKTILISNYNSVKGKDNTIVLEPEDKSFSYILNEVHDVNIIVNDKINHLLLREVKNVRIKLLHSCISGVELLRTKDVNISVPYVNYLEASFSCNIKIHSSCDFNTKLHIQHCDSIYINENLLNLTPFDHFLLSMSSQVRIPFYAPNLTSIFNYF